jgi:hypothetical protein
VQNNLKDKAPNFSRRRFIVGSAAAAGGGLSLAINMPFGAAPAAAAQAAGDTEVNAWIVIEPNDDVQNAVYSGKRPRQMLIENPIRNSAAPSGLQIFANTVATYAR